MLKTSPRTEREHTDPFTLAPGASIARLFNASHYLVLSKGTGSWGAGITSAGTGLSATITGHAEPTMQYREEEKEELREWSRKRSDHRFT